ncbi:MAG: efflux RND transporter periplasmic adaptor subunit [Colwellia sp.]|nr:efflux RND transporter periplasmic adaptor subunit [Colwellia sp.]
MNKTSYFSRYKIIIALITSIIFFYWWQSNKTVIHYETVSIKIGNIESLVGASGTLSPRYSIDVGAQVSGQIIKLTVEPGTIIKKGDLLVEIDASLQQATVDAAYAELAAQRAQLSSRQATATLAEHQFKRQASLLQNNTTSKESYHLAVANLKTSEAAIEELSAQIEQSISRLKGDEARLGYTRIYAPMSGTVLSVSATEGQTLNATYSTPNILNIADLSTMTVKAKVAEADIRYIKSDMPVWFTTLGDSIRRWHGNVRQILPAPPQDGDLTVFYTVLFDVKNTDGALMSGMTAQVFFVNEFVQNVLIAPISGLNAVNNKANVYTVRVLENNKEKPERREITTGKHDAFNAEVLDGLIQGNSIVTGEFFHSKSVIEMVL